MSGSSSKAAANVKPQRAIVVSVLIEANQLERDFVQNLVLVMKTLLSKEGIFSLIVT